jgi:hypothetical protein
MIMPRNAPPGACMDDPVETLDPVVNDRDLHFAMASHGITRIKEWAAQGNAKQRALRGDLVTLCMCLPALPGIRPHVRCLHPVSRAAVPLPSPCAAKVTGPGAAGTQGPQPGPVTGA